jgi:geranylgeranyl diphosphate synthase type II
MGSGARLRPRLCFAVAAACGNPNAPGVGAVAAAIELLHCASLVHDDLPAFDDADLRRGEPTVHRAYSEALAVLVGDALIAHAIGLGTSADIPAELQPKVVRELVACVGSVRGLVAGQAWESEPGTPLEEYHRLKTGALFEAAARLGALVAGSPDPESWAYAGLFVGEAYQIADDIRDAFSEDDGKPRGQDNLHDRPSALRSLGAREAMRRLHERIEAARGAVPDSADAHAFHAWIDAASARLRMVDPGEPREATPPESRPMPSHLSIATAHAVA